MKNAYNYAFLPIFVVKLKLDTFKKDYLSFLVQLTFNSNLIPVLNQYDDLIKGKIHRDNFCQYIKILKKLFFINFFFLLFIF